MSIPRIIRLHFVYQFILLAFIIFAACYIIQPDKKFLYLFLIPVFSYQTLIIFCCTELIPLPCWLSSTLTEVWINEQHTPNNSDTSSISSSERARSIEESPIIPRARLCTKIKKSPASVALSDANTQTSPTSSRIFKKSPAFSKARRSESTKSYVFRHNDTKLGGLDEKEQPSASYNWRSYRDQKNVKSQSNLRSPNNTVLEAKEVKSPMKLEALDECMERDSTDIARSLSFPFRQTKQCNQIEMADEWKNLNIPILPSWDAIDYFSPSNTNRRRRSVSTEAIDKELGQINSYFPQNEKNDLTKSMEINKESLIEPSTTKRGLKQSPSFNKWKQNVANYFSKTKRVNIEADDAKEACSKTPFFKELHLSKDVFCQDSGRISVSKTKSSPLSEIQHNVKRESTRFPSYISFDENFYEH